MLLWVFMIRHDRCKDSCVPVHNPSCVESGCRMNPGGSSHGRSGRTPRIQLHLDKTQHRL